MDIFDSLTIINTIIIALLSLAFFRRQKLQEIKYKEIMELNVKTHDITKRADKSLKRRAIMNSKDFDRLDYLISRYRKHSIVLSDEIDNYRQLWEKVMGENKTGKMSEKEAELAIKKLISKSEKIRGHADKLLK